jgi:hypothetical protein
LGFLTGGIAWKLIRENVEYKDPLYVKRCQRQQRRVSTRALD